jgi:hypothetical protein
MRIFLQGFIIMFLSVFLAQCVVDTRPTKKSPPPWAPAHGVRAKYRYRYYPSSYVYYDIERKLYFYLVDGIWKSKAKLPPAFLPVPGYSVIIELETGKPYKYFKTHKKKYPWKKVKPKKSKKK